MKPRSMKHHRASLASETGVFWARRAVAFLAALVAIVSAAHAETAPDGAPRPREILTAGAIYAAAPPEIPVVQPKVQAVNDYVEVTGTAASTNVVKLIARVEGYLDQIHFADGAIVKKDDLLFTIQQAQYKAQLQQAQAQLLQQQAALIYAKTEVRRYTDLFHKNAATATEVDKWNYQQKAAEAGILNAQGQIAVAQLNLDYTEVKAPFDGLMGKHLIDPGNVVGGGGQEAALAEITQLDPIYATATLSRAAGPRHPRQSQSKAPLARRAPQGSCRSRAGECDRISLSWLHRICGAAV